MTKKQNPEQVKETVETYRSNKESLALQKKEAKKAQQEELRKIQEQKRIEQEQLKIEQEEKERQEIESILKLVVDTQNMSYTNYEFNEVKKNKHFFTNLISRVFEENEQGLTFIYCEYDKSSKTEIKGYLVVTSKRVLFLTKDLNYMDKFRYQTIINVNWFNDGLIEKGLKIQYGKRRLEFDEMYDFEQLKRVGNLILNLSS